MHHPTTISLILSTLALIAAAAASTRTHDLPEIVVTESGAEVDRSCRVVIPDGVVLADEAGAGAIRITADGVVIEFADGSILRGSPPDADPDSYTGYGVRIEGHKNVTLRNVRIAGFKGGIFATRADGLLIEDSDVSDNFRQRLRSTPRTEDTTDWLWPHRNDDREWLTRYGAGIYIERSGNVTVRRCLARDVQNGLILDRVTDSRIYDNDFSFLSGWGLAMWRSSRNAVTRNAFDFCIRGYSHGVYNRGQDSGGILLFEQCSENLIAENSATHGGDGFFGFAGREALGEHPPPEPDWDYTRRGCNDNLLVKNDFSYAAAHGIEMTFSFGNRFISNRLVGNAICGVWGGYSRETLIADNHIEANGDMPYGLERGGINIEHGRDNTVHSNTFIDNACGVHLWEAGPRPLNETPWARANGYRSTDNTIVENTFTGDKVALHLRNTANTYAYGNRFENVETVIDATEGSEPEDITGVQISWAHPEYAAHGQTRPVGARDHLAGRENIIMTEWGPWDHESPLVRRASERGGEHAFDLFKVPADAEIALDAPAGVSLGVEHADGRPSLARVRADRPGVHPYTLTVTGAGVDERIESALISATWTVRVFEWDETTDPRERLDEWRALADSPEAYTATTDHLRFNYGWRGPSEIGLSDEITQARLGRDHFGTIATTTIPLPAGRWEVSTLSDDGVRVIVDGEIVIENWTHHAPTRDTGHFTLDQPSNVRITVEHFEITGYAVLEFDIRPAGD